MEKEPIGKIIRVRRKSLKKSQAEVCNGICDRSVLSKIENGVAAVSIDIICQLLDRLGLSSEVIYETEDDYNNQIRQIIRSANQADIVGNRQEAMRLLKTIDAEYDNFSLQNQQRYDVINTMLLFEDGRISADTRLRHLENSMRMTQPNYSLENLPNIMTDMEIQLLRYIATTYGIIGDYEKAIAIYCHLKHHIENNTDKVNSARKLANICYNLSKSLGLAKRYDESIAVAEEGIRYCEYSNDIRILPSCMYSCARVLTYRNNEGDRDRARELVKEALSMCTPKTWNITELSELLKKLDEELNS